MHTYSISIFTVHPQPSSFVHPFKEADGWHSYTKLIGICWLYCHFNNQFENELVKPTDRRHKHWTLALALDVIDFEVDTKNWTDTNRNWGSFSLLVAKDVWTEQARRRKLKKKMPEILNWLQFVCWLLE